MWNEGAKHDLDIEMWRDYHIERIATALHEKSDEECANILRKENLPEEDVYLFLTAAKLVHSNRKQ